MTDREEPTAFAGESIRVGVATLVPPIGRRLTLIYLILGTVLAVVMVRAAPTAGVVLIAVLVGVCGVNWWWGARIRASLRLAEVGRPEAAARVLDQLDRLVAVMPVLRGINRAVLASVRSIIAAYRGDFAAAIAHSDECARQLTPSRALDLIAIGSRFVYWQNQLNRALWLVELERTREVPAQLAVCQAAPGADWYRIWNRTVRTVAALSDAAELPDELVLRDWLHDALHYRNAGFLVACVGQALARHGQHELAREALAQVRSALPSGAAPFTRCYPRLGQLVQAALAA